MSERIDAYARKLEGLSTLELSRGVEDLMALKRKNDAELIAHLAELSRRKGHLELGYRDLFTYCQERLGLGEGQVWMRTQVAGVARRFHQVLERLARGKVSLSVLAILARHLSDENVEELLEKAEGKTTRQAKEIVAALRPKPAVEPSIRRGTAWNTSARAGERNAGETAALPGSELPESVDNPSGKVEVARPEVYNFRFSAGKDFREKLERLAEVLGIENATGRMTEVIERALDLALEKKDPKKKLERRRRREAARRSPGSAGVPPASTPRPTVPGSAGVPPASSSPRPKEVPEESDRTSEASTSSRYVASAAREETLEGASYQCEYVGPEGVRCTARVGLEIDHVEPYGKGGSSERENLRVLCRAHNMYAASREFGEEFMRRRIGERREVAGLHA